MLTDAEIAKIEGYSAIRLPNHQIASLIGMSETQLRYEAKRNPVVRRAIDEGRAKASQTIRSTLFSLAVGKKDDKGNYKIKPDFQSLKFWCQTQEGFKTMAEDQPPIGVTVNSDSQNNVQKGPQVVISIPSNGRELPDE